MNNHAQLDDLLRQAAESGEIPGVVALAADRGGIIYQGAAGKRRLGEEAPMTPDTVFWIASMTKAVTSTAAMQLVEQGRLELDTPLAGLLPELGQVQVLEGFDESGAPRLRAPRRPITLRHLLTHTSGFSYDIWNEDIGRYMEREGLPGIISCQNAALRTPLAADPGEKWEYGISIDWIGKTVEKVSGQSLEAYFRAHILGPLGMTDTGFIMGARQRARLAGMHARGADGSLTPIDFEVTQQPEFHMGGGGLYSTGPDYMKFMRMILHNGRLDGTQVLKPDTVALMAQNHIGDISVGPLKTAIPAHSNDAEFFPGMPKRWGLGFMLNMEDAPTGRSAGSLAWAGLANSYYWIDPKCGLAGIILTQILPFGDAKVLDLFARFERAVYDSALQPA